MNKKSCIFVKALPKLTRWKVQVDNDKNGN